jgi:hypothetical protein
MCRPHAARAVLLSTFISPCLMPVTMSFARLSLFAHRLSLSR